MSGYINGTMYLKATNSANSPFTDYNKELKYLNPTSGSFSISVDSGDAFKYAGWYNTGWLGNDDWEDGNTSTVVLALAVTNSAIRSRARIVSLDSSDNILQSGSWTAYQTNDQDRTYSITSPTWTHTESHSNQVGIEFEFDNTDDHGGADAITVQCNGASYMTVGLTVQGPAVTQEYEQKDFRVRDDDGSETAATWLQSANVNHSIAADTSFRVRFNMENQGNTEVYTPFGASYFSLEYSYNGGAYTTVSDSSSVIQTTLSSHFANGDDTTQQIGSGTFDTDNNGMFEASGSRLSWYRDWYNLDQSEAEFCLTIVSGDVSVDDTIDLRVIDSNVVTRFIIEENIPETVETYTKTPRITVVAAGGGGGPVMIMISVT